MKNYTTLDVIQWWAKVDIDDIYYFSLVKKHNLHETPPVPSHFNIWIGGVADRPVEESDLDIVKEFSDHVSEMSTRTKDCLTELCYMLAQKTDIETFLDDLYYVLGRELVKKWAALHERIEVIPEWTFEELENMKSLAKSKNQRQVFLAMLDLEEPNFM